MQLGVVDQLRCERRVLVGGQPRVTADAGLCEVQSDEARVGGAARPRGAPARGARPQRGTPARREVGVPLGVLRERVGMRGDLRESRAHGVAATGASRRSDERQIGSTSASAVKISCISARVAGSAAASARAACGAVPRQKLTIQTNRRDTSRREPRIQPPIGRPRTARPPRSSVPRFERRGQAEARHAPDAVRRGAARRSSSHSSESPTLVGGFPPAEDRSKNSEMGCRQTRSRPEDDVGTVARASGVLPGTAKLRSISYRAYLEGALGRTGAAGRAACCRGRPWPCTPAWLSCGSTGDTLRTLPRATRTSWFDSLTKGPAMSRPKGLAARRLGGPVSAASRARRRRTPPRACSLQRSSSARHE